MEVQRRYVPHFKGIIICGKLELTAKGNGSFFTFLHVLLKKAILYGKKGNRSNIFLPECIFIIM